jgi:hypothetical protein
MSLREVVMSIPFGERRKLRALERAITDDASALADRFAMFSTLYKWDEMPCTERLKVRDIRRMIRAERWIMLWLPT